VSVSFPNQDEAERGTDTYSFALFAYGHVQG
jgi:hypothetical protein